MAYNHFDGFSSPWESVKSSVFLPIKQKGILIQLGAGSRIIFYGSL